jgi:hypothetical protein
MSDDSERRMDDDQIDRWLRARLPRHPAPGGLRQAILAAARPAAAPRRAAWWLGAGVGSVATAMLAFLVLLPPPPRPPIPSPR